MLSSNFAFHHSVRFGIIAVLMGILTGCGFTPLYGQNLDNTDAGIELKKTMASIEVKPISDRIGQIMRTALKHGLSPKRQTSIPDYILKVSLSESIEKLSVSQSSFATRGNLHVEATYELNDAVSGAQIIHGTLKTVASYNILSSDFATQTARENAQHLAVIELAQMLKNRIAIHFTKTKLNHTSPNTKPKTSPSPKDANGINYGYPN